MKNLRIRTILKALFVLLVLGYAIIGMRVATYDNAAPPQEGADAPLETIAIFGASGTAGDGILKAALAEPRINKIHVITRRITPRMQAGIDAGKVEATIHMDYLDYAAIPAQLADVDAVYWAIGLSSLGVEEDLYRRIHIDFPVRFLASWGDEAARPNATFHYISSSDISEDANSMWARVKFEAEVELFALGTEKDVKVIAFRPDYIGPTDEEAHLGQRMLYGFFAPLGAAVKAGQIGQAMLEVTLRGNEFETGDHLSTMRIIRYSNAWESR